MFRGQGERKARKTATIAVEPLESRVVLTAGLAAARPEIDYLRAVTHLNEILQRRVAQIQNMLTRRVGRADARFVAVLDRTAPRLETGGPQVAQAQVRLARASAQASEQVDSAASQADRQMGRFASTFHAQISSVSARFGHQGALLRTAIPDFNANFHNALTAINTGVPAEGRQAQETVQAAAGGAQAAAEAATPDSSAGTRAEAAAGQLAASAGSQLASEEAVVSRFWAEYYASFNPLRAELAAIASEQLPPVHLRPGRITGPLGHSGGKIGINGTGTGTVTFTGLPGGDATTGSGFGIASGVNGTGSAGNATGSGTTTISGAGGGDTTGVGSTITAGNGANGNGIGSTGGAVGTTGGLSGTMP